MGEVLHASGSGYFTNCIQNGTGFWSLEKAMQIYWRVRTWELSASGTYFISEETQNWSYSLSDITSNAAAEEELVCGENQFEGGEENEESIAYCLIQLNNVQKSGSLYNPIPFLYISGPNDTPISISGPYSSPTPIEPEREHFISLPIFGSTGAFWRFTLPVPGTLDGTFSLEPTEWWSYGETYNTSTGARL